MCLRCVLSGEGGDGGRPARRRFLRAAGAAAAAASLPAAAQVEVGPLSSARTLVPVDRLELAGTQEYAQLLRRARAQGVLAPDDHPQLQRLRAIGQRLIPFAPAWNERARRWKWEIHLIGSQQVNAFCMPGGKIAFFAGLLEQLQLGDDEVAMVMGHEMAHALREHARERLAKTVGASAFLQATAALFGLGQWGDLGARAGTQLLALKFSRNDETEADLVGLELAARAGYDPQAAVGLWKKMGEADKRPGGLGFLSTHPGGPERIRTLEANAPKVEGLYRDARKG